VEKIPTISAKISPDLLALVKAKVQASGLSTSEIVRDALALYFGMSDQVSRDIPDVYQLRTDIEAIKAQIGELQVYTGYTAVYAPMVEHEIATVTKPTPIEAVTIASPPPPIEVVTLITESFAQPELQPIEELENNAMLARAKDGTQSQPELQPTTFDQDATTAAAPIDSTAVIWYTTTQAHQLLQARGYKKTIQSFRRDLRPSIEKRQFSSEFLAFGLVADFEARLSFESKINKSRWLRLEPIG